MAVYTTIDKNEVEEFIAPFGIGPLVSFEGIAEGFINTNYFVTTDQSDFPNELQTEPLQHYVLTIFENSNINDLLFYSKLTNLLSLKGLPVPSPVNDANGTALHYIQEKPALLFPKIEGTSPTVPTTQHCHELGSAVAQIHKIFLDAKLTFEGMHCIEWLQQQAMDLKPLLSAPDQALLKEIPRFMNLIKKHSHLPQSIIHSNMIKKNTKFQDTELSAITHFNNATMGFLMLDLAIVVNDWCIDDNGILSTDLSNEILHSYQKIRSFTPDEIQLWNDFLRIAALWSWLSNLITQHPPEFGHQTRELLEPVNPQHYKNILLQHTKNPSFIK